MAITERVMKAEEEFAKYESKPVRTVVYNSVYDEAKHLKWIMQHPPWSTIGPAWGPRCLVMACWPYVFLDFKGGPKKGTWLGMLALQRVLPVWPY